MTCPTELAAGKNPGFSTAPIFLFSFSVCSLILSKQPLLYSAFDIDGRLVFTGFGFSGRWRGLYDPINRPNHLEIRKIHQTSNPSNQIYKVIHCRYIGEKMVLFIVSPSKKQVLNDDSLLSGVFQGNYEQPLGPKQNYPVRYPSSYAVGNVGFIDLQPFPK
ncbi:MAG: hypothetical protein O6704_00505 [Nitrospinae bacterium]|nr:hypothetical protein [Nitrospinota bacterium]